MIAGVSGHRDLGEAAAIAWVRGAIDVELQRHAVTHGMTSLAEGADQLFAQLLASHGIPFDAVIPCDGYDETFTTPSALASFQDLLARASKIHRLPFVTPTEEAFLAAGKWIVNHCELLVAVWNGLPARGLGGTGDIVAYAQERNRRWIHLNPIDRSVAERTP